MSFDNFPSHEVFTGIKLKFQATRVLDGLLVPARFTARIELAHMDIDSPDAISTTYQKIMYFADHVLDGSVIINRMDEWSVQTFVDIPTGLPNCANNLVMLPGSASNIVLAETLHAKFSKLAAGGIYIAFVNLVSDDAGGLSTTSIGDPNSVLPTMDEWTGSETNYFSDPWWDRDDASTMDVAPAEDANLAEPPEFAYSLAFLLEEPEEAEDTPPKVVRVEFRPRVIQGGKKD